MFIVDGNSYPLAFDVRNPHIKISKPAPEDYENLPTHELESSFPFDPEDKIIRPNQRGLNNKN